MNTIHAGRSRWVLIALLVGFVAIGTVQAQYAEDFSKGDGGWTGYYRYPQGHRMEQGHRGKGCLYADSSARFSAPKELLGDLRARYGAVFALRFSISDYYSHGGVARLSVSSGDSRWQWDTDIDSATKEWQSWTITVPTDDSDGWTRIAGKGSFSDLWQDVTALEIIPSRGAGMHFDDVSCGPTKLRALSPGIGAYSIAVQVKSEITYPRVPLDPTIDFGRLLRQAGVSSAVDLNSIKVVNVSTDKTVPHALEGFGLGSRGQVEWVVQDPRHRAYEIHFRTAASPRPLAPRPQIPLIGVGDLLRYNAGGPRPVTPIYVSGLVDMDGDGKRDLVGVWNYAHRPGTPWSGCVYFPRVGEADEFRFGDMVRVPRLPGPVYGYFAVADLNRDGLPDFVHTDRNAKTAAFYARAEKNGVYEAAGSVDRQGGDWTPVRCVDLDGDGAQDLLFGKWRLYSEGTIPEGAASCLFLPNRNPKGWPFEAGKAQSLGLGGIQPDFLDVDQDGRLDAVCLVPDPKGKALSSFLVGWQRNLGGSPPRFSPVELLTEVNSAIWRPTGLAAVREGPRQGILLVTRNWQRTEFFELKREAGAPASFGFFAVATSASAVISASDQAAPFVCDWDDDGDLDLLVGGGYGWPQIILNEGTDTHPAYAEQRLIQAAGQPIHLLRDEILGPPACWHNMGYLFPSFVDWDGDGLRDLMLPNETNRILWFPNVGTRKRPAFGTHSQIMVDGFSDSPALRTATAELVAKSPHVYPKDKSQPFHWRSDAAFIDVNDDGLMDMIAPDWSKYSLGLFLRYRDANGQLRLKRERTLKTTEGKAFTGTRVNALDWDGDGCFDIVYSRATGDRSKDTIFLARNVGSNADPVFEPERPLRAFGKPIYITRHGPHPWAGDLDGDGKPDLLCYVEWSVYPFYTHAVLAMPERPTLQLGPALSRQ